MLRAGFIKVCKFRVTPRTKDPLTTRRHGRADFRVYVVYIFAWRLRYHGVGLPVSLRETRRRLLAWPGFESPGGRLGASSLLKMTGLCGASQPQNSPLERVAVLRLLQISRWCCDSVHRTPCQSCWTFDWQTLTPAPINLQGPGSTQTMTPGYNNNQKTRFEINILNFKMSINFTRNLILNRYSLHAR